MNIPVVGLTIETLGEILLGLTVLFVHWHVIKEHKIDSDVLRTMKKEQIMGITGLVLIIVGYLIQVYFRI